MNNTHNQIIIQSDNNSNKYQIEDEWDIDYRRPLNKYKSALRIGVYLATNKKDGTQVAVKILSLMPLIQSKEINTLKSLMKIKHQNITSTLGYKEGDCIVDGVLHKDCLFIFREYLNGYKTILEMVNENYKFTESQIRLVAYYLLFALTHLHSNSIVLTHITGGNVLIKIGSSSDDLDIKLIGFRLSSKNKSNINTFFGISDYMAPEVYGNNIESSKSDIRSLGCTLLEMAGGNITNRFYGIPKISSHISSNLKNLIQHCLIDDPRCRLKSNELLNHKFINIGGLELSNLNKEILNSTIIQQVELNNVEFNTAIIVDSNIKHVILNEFNQDIKSLQNKLPTTVTSLSLPVFNQPIQPNSIPSHIKSLSIPSFNHDLEDEVIPSTIKELILGEAFEFNENGGNLPDTIKKFTCNYRFSRRLAKNNNIPRRVSTLVLDNYNHPITKGSIPSTVHTLTLGSSFQHFSSLSNLPSSIFNLTFGVHEDYLLDDNEIIKYIPNDITNITIKRLGQPQQHNPNEWSIDYSKPLGKGEFSVGVYKGIKLDCKINNKVIPNGGECAIKVIQIDQINPNETATLEKLVNIQYNNIIKIYGYEYGYRKEKKCLFIYMEFLNGYDTLSNYITNQRKIEEKQISKFACDLVYTLVHLHQFHKIIHRDIKSDNILVDRNGGNLKVIDFGLSKYFGSNDSSQYNSIAGTLIFMAPETNPVGRSCQIKPSSKSDIWSAGCTLLQMVGGDLSNKESIPSHLSNACKNFIQHCLIEDPSGRPKAIELLHHEFINNIETSQVNKNIKNNYLSSLEKRLYSVRLSNEQLKDIPFIEESISLLELTNYNNLNYENDFRLIPRTVTSLSLPLYNQVFSRSSIPSHIHSLLIPSFNHDLEDEVLPATLSELILGEAFKFNEYGGSLPDTIKKFTCSHSFNKSLPRHNNIPKKVSTLVLDNYNQPITKGSIPSTVHTLTLGSNYQHFESLSNLPSSVFNLTFGVSNQCTLTNDQIKQFIPSNVTKIIIKRNELSSGDEKKSELNSNDLSTPDEASIKPTTHQPFILNETLDLDSLSTIPTTTTSLLLPYYNNKDLKLFKSLPAHITSLSVPLFNQDIEEDIIPSTLSELILGEAFEFNEYGGNLANIDTIKKFTCSYNFKSSIKKINNIPKAVSTLVLDNYNHPILNGSIPSTVHTLTLGSNYQHFSSLSNLPSSVENVTFGVSNECTLTNNEIKQLIPSHIKNIITNRHIE